MNTPMHVGDAARRRRIGRQHRLAQPFWADSAAVVADSVVALHSSDPVTVYLSVLARCDTDIEAVSAALYEDRSLARVHGMRRTLWVATVPVAQAISTASAKRLTGPDKRRLARSLEEAGITDDGDGWIDDAMVEILDYLDEVAVDEALDTRSIGLALPHLAASYEIAQGKKYSATVSAHGKVLLLMGFAGSIVRAAPLGSWIASQYQWMPTKGWLGLDLVAEDSPDELAAAQRAVIARYLKAFGPVTETDLKWWTAWPLTAIRQALVALESRQVTLDGGQMGWLSVDDDGTEADGDLAPWVAVLPGLDPTVMGWKERDWYLDPDHVGLLFDRNGNAGPTIMIDGRIVGGWVQRDVGELAYRLLDDIGGEATEMVEAALDRLATHLGETRFKVRFPAPLGRQLR